MSLPVNPVERGGGFLLGPPPKTLAPEGFDDQQRLIAQTAEAFAQDEILKATERIEAQEPQLVRNLLRRAGALGLTGVDVPEAYGGMGLDWVASAIVADHLAVLGSFSVAFGAHVGIATLPLLHFGSEEQKQKYLPRLASAEWVGAYALSEAGSGSDALAMRAEATLRPNGGGYLLNGEKMWISNAGFADLFTVFAKLEGKVAAFLVERAFRGVDVGPEEKKMGIHGSSTRPLLLRDAEVPASNRLGGPADGKRIAFQTLNIGRFKLGAACIGGARNLLREAAIYAKERRAFGKPLAEFGLIQQMLADAAVELWVHEAAVYRTAGLLAAESDLDEFAAECSIVKVAASEMLDRLADRAVQLFGGNGFVHGNPAERAYRDARVNRIFEGTNEINRLLLSGLILRKAEKGSLPLLPAIANVQQELMAPPGAMAASERTRKLGLLLAGLAHQQYGTALADQQELLACLSDLMIATYLLQAAESRGADNLATQVFAAEILSRLEAAVTPAFSWIATGDALRTQLVWVRRLVKHEPADTWRMRRQIARELLG